MLRNLIDVPVTGMRLIKSGSYIIHTATMTSRSTRGGPLKLKSPFPYEEKKLSRFQELLDPTIVRVSGENSKLIVVEGSIGAGKSAFCQALADEFDLKFYPQPTMDELFITHSGYDLRKHDNEVPEDIRTYDHKNFCLNPFTVKAAILQLNMLYLKFFQYLNAMCHLLNTGQGVILERSYLSDYIFLKAMVENKFIDQLYLKVYHTVRKNITTFFPFPHLIVYLDMPVPVVQERIKTRNFSYEQNSPALTPQYLASLEKYMKQDYLKTARSNSDILIYDWSDGGNIDVVIDDIENMDFDIMRGDKKFISWRLNRKSLYSLRYTITNMPHEFDQYFAYPWHELDELFKVIRHSGLWFSILQSIPELKYDYGYNYHAGDNFFKILFDMVDKKHRIPRYHYEREID